MDTTVNTELPVEDKKPATISTKAFCRKCGGRCNRIVDYRWHCDHCGTQPYPAAIGDGHDR
jgi:hypothetical protein